RLDIPASAAFLRSHSMNLNSMTPKHWLIAIAILILLAGAGGYLVPNYRSHDMPSEAASGERKVLYWHDPMVPGQRFDKPGKSPFMDMQLVPVYADEAGGSGVKGSTTVQQNLGMRMTTVRRVDVSSSFDAIGAVQFDE